MKPLMKRAKPLHIIKHGSTWKRPVTQKILKVPEAKLDIKDQLLMKLLDKTLETKKPEAVKESEKVQIFKLFVTVVDPRTKFGKFVILVMVIIFTLITLKSTGLLDLLV